VKTVAEPRVKLSRLLALAAPEWRRLLPATLFLFLGSAMSLLYPQVISRIVDAALGKGGQATIDRLALLLAGIFAVEGVAVGLRAFLFSVAGERVVARLRERLYRAILAQEVGFFDRRGFGAAALAQGPRHQLLDGSSAIARRAGMRRWSP
jgi:ATP-binding cassette subfamily B protein